MGREVPRAVVQLFVWHSGERVDYVHAPAGSGKRAAVQAWLDGAGGAADQIWLESASVAGLERVPLRPAQPTFVDAADYGPNDDLETRMLEIVAETPPQLGFVITSIRPPSPKLTALARTGLIRITAEDSLRAAYNRA